MEYYKEKPFIHLFQTPLGNYFYDVNTNEIVKIDLKTYEYLNGEVNNETDEIRKKLYDLEMNGYLKKSHVEITKHPLTDILPFYATNKIGQLILQVTQRCNLHCEYCVYSGNYETRNHTNKKMSLSIAKKAIDFFQEHSTDQNNVTIGFYGGEPFLEFELIKECVAYAEDKLEGKKIEYSVTTNATLLTDEIIEYLIFDNFFVTVSLDGPREIQDECRRFLYNNKGTFDIVMKNLRKIKEKDINYFEKNVRINTVLVVERGYECIDQFFKEENIFENLMISASTVSDNYAKTKSKISEEFHIEQQYELFKTFLVEIGELEKEKESSLLSEYLKQLYEMCRKSEEKHRNELPKSWHRGGPCLPGIMRLFVNAEGILLPCERVCEISECAQIGTLEKGLDLEKMQWILNIEKVTEDECHKCWAYSECSGCIRFGNNCREDLKKLILKKCPEIKGNVENAFKDFTVLCELGYDFDKLDC